MTQLDTLIGWPMGGAWSFTQRWSGEKLNLPNRKVLIHDNKNLLLFDRITETVEIVRKHLNLGLTGEMHLIPNTTLVMLNLDRQTNFKSGSPIYLFDYSTTQVYLHYLDDIPLTLKSYWVKTSDPPEEFLQIFSESEYDLILTGEGTLLVLPSTGYGQLPWPFVYLNIKAF